MHGATYGILLLKPGTHLPPDPTYMRGAITPNMPIISSQSLSLVLSIRRISLDFDLNIELGTAICDVRFGSKATSQI
jgi:hypothetical protein